MGRTTAPLLVLALCLAAAATTAAAARHRPRPKCKDTYAAYGLGMIKLPACSTPVGTRGRAGAVAAAAAGTSTAYPCAVGDAACYCRWRNALGMWQDNDPSVGCASFYWCYAAGTGAYMACGPGLLFHPAGYCDWPANVQCPRGGAASPPPSSAAKPPPPAGAKSPPPRASPPPPPPPPPPPARVPTSPSPPPPRTPVSQPPPPIVKRDITRLISSAMWDSLFPNIRNWQCKGGNFYTYNAFVQATAQYPTFANSGNDAADRRELAAFLAQISQETTGGGDSWGLCWTEELCAPNCPTNYCDPGATAYPCTPGKSYHGRGPIQLSWNYNYGFFGAQLGVDLLRSPELILSDPVLAFRTALWFWTTPQSPKPSCSDVMSGRWAPSAADAAAGRLPGFGLTTNVINGGIECGAANWQRSDVQAKVNGRVAYFRRYAQLLGTATGDNLLCNAQQPYV